MLIAGCGTGQHAIETAQRFPAARVLAIDLSLTSLAYALRKTREIGVRQPRICPGRHPQARRDRSNLRRHRVRAACCITSAIRLPAGACCCRCCGRAASWRSASTARWRAPTSSKARSVHRGTRLWLERRRHSPLPAGPDRARGRKGVSRCVRVERFLQHQRLPRPAVPRAGAPPDHSADRRASSPTMHSISSASNSRPRWRASIAPCIPPTGNDGSRRPGTHSSASIPGTFAGMYQFWVQKRA